MIRDFQMLRRGENTGEYDWEYITELFQSNPENVPEMAYGAMIILFNEMETNEQEQFIEVAYTKYGELHSVSNLGVLTDYSIQKRELMLSDVFKQMVALYGEVIATGGLPQGNSLELENLQGKYNILSSVATHADKVYVYGGGEEDEIVNIKISSANDINEPTYRIEYDAVGKLMDSNGLAIHDNLIINVYEMGDYKKIKGIFKTIAQDILLTHYENATIGGGKELSEGILSIVVDKLIGESKITDGIGAVHTVVSCVTEVGETMDTNRDIEDIQNLLTTAGTYEALRLHASVSTSGNEYSIHLFYMETDELKTLIQEYNAWAVTVTGYEKMETDISVIAQAIQAGNLESVTGIEDYVKWFIWHYSEEKESEESEEIYVAN